MSERHELELDAEGGAFSVEAIIDDDGDVEVVFSRGGAPQFRAGATDLSVALAFVEQHAGIQFVEAA